jgi:class 3 adenylate cyclase
VLAHHGRVLQYLGDGLLAVFGADQSSERDPERAIHAALDIIAQIPNAGRYPHRSCCDRRTRR